MLKAVSKHVLQPFAGELRPVFSTVKGLRNPLYIYFFDSEWINLQKKIMIRAIFKILTFFP